MADSPSPVTLNDVPRIVDAKPLSLSWTTHVVLGLFIAVGAVAFLQELFSGDARHAWTSLQVNFMYWFCVAAASSGFAAVFQICNAQWSRPIRRIFESALPFLMISPLLLVVLYFGHEYLFVWAHTPIAGKEKWLTSNFVYARDIAAILLLAWLTRKVVHLSIRRDLLAIRGGLTGLDEKSLSRWQEQRYDRFVRDADANAKDAIAKTSSQLGVLSPILVWVYALSMSLIAFDQIMSVDPHWFSTMFGGFYFMSAVYLAMAFAAIGVAVLRQQHPLFLAKIERRTLWDLGKLLFGFGIFWAYLFWSHYLPIWYGNLPEETAWIIVRLREQPWHGIAWFVLGSCFIVPFLLGLSRDVKQVPILLFGTALIVAIGLWVQMYLLFAPTLYPDTIPLSFTDLFVTLGFLGAYLLSASYYLERVPLIPFGDLY
ncbi:MAG: hypothetical protein KDD69_02080 [Bdellovibrionales bacterium]|nr:hypothetical protein [Bdellovibrionales bacterium]